MFVIPAQAGIHRQRVESCDDIQAMGTRLRGYDGKLRSDGERWVWRRSVGVMPERSNDGRSGYDAECGR